MAVIIAPGYSLGDWQTWWYRYTDRSVIWADDTQGEAVVAFGVYAVGTKVIVDRQGRLVYHSGGAAGYDVLNAAVKRVL